MPALSDMGPLSPPGAGHGAGAGAPLPPPPPSPPSGPTAPSAPRYPYRARRDRGIAGVARGLSIFLGIDAIWVRLAFVAATFVAGAGIAVYLAAWLALPEEGEPEAGRTLLRANRNRVFLAGVVLVLLCFGVLADGPGDGFPDALLLIIAGIALWLWRVDRLRQPSNPGPPPPPPGVPVVPAATAVWSAPEPPPVHAPAPVPRPPQPRSILTPIGVAASLAILAAATLLDRLDWLEVSATVALSIALAVTAAALLVSVVMGRARGLIGWGIVLSITTMLSTAAGALDLPFTAGIGDRNVRVTVVEDLKDRYALTMGELDVDLSALDLAGATEEVEIRLGVGQVEVWVPEDVALDIDARAGLGHVVLLDQEQDGVNARDELSDPGTEGAGTLVLDVSTAMGEVRVQRRAG